MNTATNQTTAVPSNPKRVILASAYRHERHSTSRQKRALKSLRKMGPFDDHDARNDRRIHRILHVDETMDD